RAAIGRLDVGGRHLCRLFGVGRGRQASSCRALVDDGERAGVELSQTEERGSLNRGLLSRIGPVRRSRWTSLGDRLTILRADLDSRPTLRRVYRFGVAVLGGLVLVAGIIMIPYPGPGWLVVFAGLAILATEFVWADRVLAFVRRYYHAWTGWLG